MIKKNKKAKLQASFIILNLIIAVIAFAFILGLNLKVVSGKLVGVSKPSDLKGGDTITNNYKSLTIRDGGIITSGDTTTISGIGADGQSVTIQAQSDKIISQYEIEKYIPGDAPPPPAAPNPGAIPEQTYAEQYLGYKNPLPGGSPLTGGQIAWNGILAGAEWAVLAYGAGQLIGDMLGLQKPQTKSLSAGMAVGFGLYKALATWGMKGSIFAQGGFKAGFGVIPGQAGWLGLGPVGIGLVAGAIVLLALWKEESQKIVTFECLPWEAPSKGENCEKCNTDLHACSEYRCKSLGQACMFLNAGTNKELCAWNSSNDVNSPIMKAWDYPLNKEYSYKPNTAIRPPDNGVKIINSQASDGCVKAFTPLSFGITTNEPAQCKIGYNRTLKFADMPFNMGGDSLYLYNHTQTLNLPGPDQINAEAPELKNNGVYNLYVRCRDVNGNENADLFIFNFCVEKGPDVTAPIITATSIQNNMPVQFGLNETPLDIYLNEPADCRWSKTNMPKSSYKEMEGAMTCSQKIWEINSQMLYKCSTLLTGLQNAKDNVFYFKCRDQPLLGDSSDRNINDESYKFVLKGSQNTLAIANVKPNGTIQGSGTLATTYLGLTTKFGSNDGDAFCSYSETQNEKDYIQMKETGTNVHSQRLDLPAGSYTYYFQCVDLGGNAARDKTTFNVEIDKTAPEVLRIYNEAGKLKIITDEESTCSYSNNNDEKCSFLIQDGINMPKTNSTDHYAEWTDSTYYIKCMDKNGNQPYSTECSIIVKPEK